MAKQSYGNRFCTRGRKQEKEWILHKLQELQALGARKYCLNGLFGIDDAKDADTDEHKHQQNAAAKQSKTITLHLNRF